MKDKKKTDNTDKNKIDVSIIVPVYNVENYIERCLDSLILQTLTDIEIIVVNDGSTDRSKEIVEKYALEYPKLIRAYHQKNTGLSGARNFGIKQAKGTYIGFVDSDDWVAPDMYKEMHDKAIKADSEIVVCAYSKIDLEKNITSIIKLRGKVEEFGNSIGTKPNLLYASHSLACNKIFHKKLLIEPFPLGQWYEDSAVVYAYMKRANRISCVNKPLYFYRINREGAITKTISPEIFDIFKSIKSIEKQFELDALQDKKIKRVLEKIIIRHIFARYNTLTQTQGHLDKRLAYKFVSQSFDYLNKTFPNWKKNYKISDKNRNSYLFKMRKSKSLFYIYLLVPDLIANWEKRKLEKLEKLEKRAKDIKRKNLKKYGYQVLENLNIVFENISLQYFADFGTLLGFIRESDFMRHDLNLDLGVFATEKQKLQLSVALNAAGYRLWRSYYYNDKVVMESYHFVDKKNNILLKFDIHFYEHSADSSKTWLFYTSPNSLLEKRERNVIEMTYGKIEEITYITIKDVSIPIPKNAKSLLKEKYGEEWKIPNSDWIYWESPAAKSLEKTGYYTTKTRLDLDNDKIKLLQKEQLKILEALKIVCEKEG